MKNAFDIVRSFENELAQYTGAPHVVAVNSCTNALFLCLYYQRHIQQSRNLEGINDYVEIPKLTYLSVPMQAKVLGFKIKFRDEDWQGLYQLKPFMIFDAARKFTSNMFANYERAEWNKLNDVNLPSPKMYMCVSFHWSKILGIQQGGAILTNDDDFNIWARRARFDGRTEGVAPIHDDPILGFHMYMSPEIAAEGLVRLMHLPRVNKDLPRDNYPDLSKLKIFQ